MTTERLVTAVTPDIFQIQIPLPFALRIVNCYLLRGDGGGDTGGWTVIDSGLNTSKARAAWQEAFAELRIRPREIEQIVLTHTHPDHYGLAGWLGEWCVADGGNTPPVRLSAREAELADGVWKMGTMLQSSYVIFWQQCAVPTELAAEIVRTTEETRQRTFPHPAVHHIIAAERPPMSQRHRRSGTFIRLGNRQMQALLMPGHSDGQLVFYDANDQLLLCGDHVLLKITPNISLWPHGEPDPLGRYLDSLETLKGLEVRLALPGHGPLIEDIDGRITQIAHHHTQRLEETLAVLTEPMTVYEVSHRLFDHEILSMHEMRFAATETLAHLDYLVQRGQVEREGEEIWKFVKRSA